MSTLKDRLVDEQRAFHDLKVAVEQAVQKANLYSVTTDDPRAGVVEAVLHLDCALALLLTRRAE